MSASAAPKLTPLASPAVPVDPGVRIGHVHLKVSDIQRSLGFWRDVLGFEVMQQREGAVFIAAGGYHVAILYPTRAALGRALARVHAAGIELTGASDHGVSIALYLDDPDRNGVELYWDKPESDWPRAADGKLNMGRGPVDLAALIRDGAA